MKEVPKMIEGVATASTVSQNHPETVQTKVDTPVETTPDVVEGKVNPVDDVETLLNRAGADEPPNEHNAPHQENPAGHIVDLLG
jgi:hypothetical protein